jgi:hypothetical protein
MSCFENPSLLGYALSIALRVLSASAAFVQTSPLSREGQVNETGLTAAIFLRAQAMVRNSNRCLRSFVSC